jgi:eukaryotic-like serine/threonine-protein kinase
VLATLPDSARRRVPLRMRRQLPIVAVVALLAVAAALVVILVREGIDRTESGTGQGTAKPPAGNRVVSVKRTSASAFDPLGDDEEHNSEEPLVVDKDSGTKWSTETYQGGNLGKDGVGIYVDADPGVGAKSIEIETPDPGWTAEIRVADGKRPPAEIDGWQKAASGEVNRKRKRFKLNGDRHRYYLVWITDLGDGAERAVITDIALFAHRG